MEQDQFLRIRNFERFQHYRDRRPPWIKLYRDLWDDPRFFTLCEEERYVLISLFIVASQNDNRILNNPRWLARQCMTSVQIMTRALVSLTVGEEPWIETAASKPLEKYLQDASKALAECSTPVEHVATLETETETDPPIVPQNGNGSHASTGYSSEFEKFWEAYPKRIGKGEAFKSWKKLKPSQALQEIILAAVEQQKAWVDWKKENGKYIPNPTTWLNQSRWDDEGSVQQAKAASYNPTGVVL